MFPGSLQVAATASTSASEISGKKRLIERPLGLNAGNRSPTQKVVGVLLGQSGRLALITFLVDAFRGAQQVGLLASELRLGEPVLSSALRLFEQCRKSRLDPVLLHPGPELHEVDRLDECPTQTAGPKIGGIST